MPIIYVDADACPVRAEILKVAERYNLKTVMVCDGGIRPSRDPMVQIVVVPHGADAADDWIAERSTQNDIVVTQDILLAARCLENGSIVLGPNGKEFNKANIGNIVAMRELNQHLRETGMGGSFNKPFDGADRSRFLQALDLAVHKISPRAKF